MGILKKLVRVNVLQGRALGSGANEGERTNLREGHGGERQKSESRWGAL